MWAKSIPFLLLGTLLPGLAGLYVIHPPARAGSHQIRLVVDGELQAPARHGLEQLLEELGRKGFQAEVISSLEGTPADLLVLGVTGRSEAAHRLAEAAGLELPQEAEGLLVHRLPYRDQEVLLLCGADDRGLMYAALEVAERVRLSPSPESPLAGVENAAEKPSVRFRSVARMLMNRAVVEEYFYSEDYWTKYLNMLAKNRFNNFTLMFGYGAAGYFEPPYPFLFDVPEFPEVKVVGLSNEEQERNFRMLERIIQMAHQRGLEFTVALWTHIFVPGHNNYLGDGFRPKLGFPTGLTQDNLAPYTRVALKRFLEHFPEIDRLQFRLHVESSVQLPQQAEFWREIFRVIEQARPDLPIDMRAKGFSDDLIQVSLESPLRVRLATKHWGEELGLPFHPTQDSLANKYKRRHSYADLLRYPKRYDLLWRLWSHGSVKILLWGDPEHARRFAGSTLLYDGDGFEIHEPLAMKMGYKRGLHDLAPYPLLAERYRHYDWEFERYWHFYQVFGRTGYNFQTPERVWREEFEHRFGKQAAPFVRRAYSEASRVLPRIVAYATRDLSAGYSWPEKRRWEDLPEYIRVRPSDTAQFLGIDEAAGLHLAGRRSAKIWPEENSRWFEETSRRILHSVEQAEQHAGPPPGKEFRATVVDMKVLAFLASYHSRRIRAGWHFALFEETGDLNALDQALHYEKAALHEWEKIVDVTAGVYPENIIMGRAPDMEGNWASELELLRQGLAELQELRRSFQPSHRRVVARLDFGEGPAQEGFLRVTPQHRYSPAQEGFGWHHLYASSHPTALPTSATEARLSDFIQGPEPDSYTYSAFGIDLPNGHYELLFSMADLTPQAKSHGPMWIVAEGEVATERFRIPAGQVVEQRLEAAVADGRLDLVFNSTTDGDWIVNSLVITRLGPSLSHVPVRRSSGKKDLPIRVTACGPDPLSSARLVYGSPATGYRILPLQPTGPFTYEAAIPGADLVEGLEYFLEVEDVAGRMTRFPEGEAETVQVGVSRDTEPPRISHRAVPEWNAGQPLVVEAQVEDPSGVDAVYVNYRSVNQHQDFHRLLLLPTASGSTYRAEIPGHHLDPRWDFMYFLEAFDRQGNGTLHPQLEKETPYVVVRLRRDGTPSR